MKLKKRVNVIIIAVIISFLLIFLTSFIIGQYQDEAISDGNSEPQSEIDNAYSCLEDELGDNCGGTKSTKQSAFNLLAVSYDSKLQNDCKTSLKEKKKQDCWGETDVGTCNIKSTALAILALNNIGENTDDSVKWLSAKKIDETGLTWYLEIDADNKTECDVNGKKIIIEENKKISGTPPSGLAKSYNDYWFQINDIKKNYSVSCDKDFITALVYQKPGSTVFHVSSETQSASEFDKIIVKVNSYCLSTSNICDYEGTLWSSITLAKKGEDISGFIPFLTSMADEAENRKYLPSAFLYIITDSDDYYSELISLQKPNYYWDESRNKLYDTALALLSLQNVNLNEVENAKKYLLSVQKENGCWQSDTSFILYSAWPKSPSIPNGVGVSYCIDFNNFCVSIGNCDLTNTLDNYYCQSPAEVCCRVRQQEPSCSEKNGVVCELNQECNGEKVTASDTNDCCIGDCREIETETKCEESGFYCKDSCSEAQEEKTDYSQFCNAGQICCGSKKTKESNFLLIVLLATLIILVILAIIFRNQLRVWFFKRKSDYKIGKQKPFSRPPGATFPIPRQFPQTFVRPQRIIPKSGEKDKEFEETMKKLKEMSK